MNGLLWPCRWAWACILCGFLAPSSNFASAEEIVWTGKGDGSSWTDRKNWNPNQVPGEEDAVFIKKHGNVGVGRDAITIKSLNLHGSLSGAAGSLEVREKFTWTGGLISAYGGFTIIIRAGAALIISGDDEKSLVGADLYTSSANGLIERGARFRLSNNAVLHNDGTLTIQTGVAFGFSPSPKTRFLNRGTLRIEAPASAAESKPGEVDFANLRFDAGGTIEFQHGCGLRLAVADFRPGLRFTGGGLTRLGEYNTEKSAAIEGDVVLDDKCVIELVKGGQLHGDGGFRGLGTFIWTGGDVSSKGKKTHLKISPMTRFIVRGGDPKRLDATLDVATRGWVIEEGSKINLSNGAVLRNSGDVAIRPGVALPTYSPKTRFENAGAMRIGESHGDAVSLGRFVNSGVLTVVSGVVRCEDSFTQMDDGVLIFEVAGKAELRDFGRIEVGLPRQAQGHAVLAGELAIRWTTQSFSPGESDTFELMRYQTRVGEFGSVRENRKDGWRRYWAHYFGKSPRWQNSLILERSYVPRRDWYAQPRRPDPDWHEYPKDVPLADVLDRIVVHHTARPQDESVLALQIAEMSDKISLKAPFKNIPGYSDLPYHFVITKDGTIYEGRDIQAVGAHAGAFNGNNDVTKDPDYGAIGIVLTGNFEGQPMQLEFQDKPTPGQLASLKWLLTRLCQKYTIRPGAILRHNEVKRDGNPTVCPGKALVPEVNRIRREIESEL